jgi:hypothetical protein
LLGERLQGRQPATASHHGETFAVCLGDGEVLQKTQRLDRRRQRFEISLAIGAADVSV